MTDSTTSDRHDVEDLVQALAACLDEGRFADLRELFTADATARTPGGAVEGADALVAQAARNHTAERATQHLIGGLQIALDGDTATARANALVTFASLGGRPELVMGEVYRFGARRTADGWRLTRVETAPTWRVEAAADAA